MSEGLGDQIRKLTSEMDTATRMLLVASMDDATVFEANVKLLNVSRKLGDIANEMDISKKEW